MHYLTFGLGKWSMQVWQLHFHIPILHNSFNNLIIMFFTFNYFFAKISIFISYIHLFLEVLYFYYLFIYLFIIIIFVGCPCSWIFFWKIEYLVRIGKCKYIQYESWYSFIVVGVYIQPDNSTTRTNPIRTIRVGLGSFF